MYAEMVKKKDLEGIRRRKRKSERIHPRRRRKVHGGKGQQNKTERSKQTSQTRESRK